MSQTEGLRLAQSPTARPAHCLPHHPKYKKHLIPQYKTSLLMGIDHILKNRTRKIDEVLNDLVSEFVFPLLRKPSLHLIKAGGKRIRPVISLLVAEGFECDPEFVLPPAASIELMHTASLIHDDVIDKCTIRRNVPSVHVKWDTTTAILAGDALLSVAVRALVIPLVKSNIGGISLSFISEDLVENLDLFSKFWGQICEGKRMDVLTDYRTLTERNVNTLTYKKTAVLFELAGRIGANYSGATKEESLRIGEFGRKIGMAFQFRDDILGLVGDENVLGKNVGVDITNGKKTMIVCHFLKNAPRKDAKKLRDALGNQKLAQEDIRDLVDKMKDLGSVDYTAKKAMKFIDDAKEDVEVLHSENAKDSLIEISDYIARRFK